MRHFGPPLPQFDEVEPLVIGPETFWQKVYGWAVFVACWIVVIVLFPITVPLGIWLWRSGRLHEFFEGGIAIDPDNEF